MFGTDGVRGYVGTELTAKKAFEIGLAGAKVLAKRGEKPCILLGMDPRISSDMLMAALTAGICSVGVDVYNAGVVPAPAVAYLVRKYGFAAGVMVSASHNAYYDNGIKFYNGDGYKLTDEIEDEIEALMQRIDEIAPSSGVDVGRVLGGRDPLGDYAVFLQSCVGDVSLSGLKIALDCSNGAAYQVAPRVFKALGADVSVIADKPDGVNINDGCGSTHIETLAKHIKAGKYDMAFAFDGDGDRCFALDDVGDVLDGDMIMNIIGTHWQSKGLLAKNTVVATIMSNLGLIKAAKESGINVKQTKVGDRYVLEEMMAGGYCLGGEQSGHIICLNRHTTGDGVLTALVLAAIVVESGKNLGQLNTMVQMPQVLVNAKIKNEAKAAIMAHEAIVAEIAALEQRFAGSGRVVIRPSGTEPLLRVMIEGEDIKEITAEAKRIAGLMEELAEKV